MTNFWDFLRPLDQIAVDFTTVIVPIVFIISIVIFGISLFAYLKVKSTRMLLITLAFFIFMIKWLLQFIDLFISPGFFFSNASQGVVELVIMLLILAAILKK